MKALIVTPLRQGARTGNRITAERWAGLLRDLDHEPAIAETYTGQECDLLIALHAAKSASSIARYREQRSDAPLVVALTGTDLYRDIRTSEEAQRSLGLATRLVVLHSRGEEELPEHLRGKVRPILQSVEPVGGVAAPREDRFEVCVLGHLRPVKDPFRAAEAAQLLPAESRIHVLQVGAALEPEMEERARSEQDSNPRYSWLGALERDEALRVLARCRLLVLSSRMEGGANVISEAVVHEVPVISSRIHGSFGLLGEDYPGYFSVGDTDSLAALMRRAETDRGFCGDLLERCKKLAPLFAPEREREAWRALLEEVISP